MEHKPTLPPAYLFTSLAVMVLLHFFAPLTEVAPRPWNAIGLAPLAIGIALNLSAGKAFTNQGNASSPYEIPTALMTTGIYKYSRNPMYLGMSLMLLGVALLLGSATPYIVVPGFIMVMDRWIIRFEENMLEKQFGRRWEEYKKSVRRWL